MVVALGTKETAAWRLGSSRVKFWLALFHRRFGFVERCIVIGSGSKQVELSKRLKSNVQSPKPKVRSKDETSNGLYSTESYL